MPLFYNYFIYFSEKVDSEDKITLDTSDAIENQETIEEQPRMNYLTMGEVLEMSYKPGPLSKKKLLRGKYFAK